LQGRIPEEISTDGVGGEHYRRLTLGADDQRSQIPRQWGFHTAGRTYQQMTGSQILQV
jgi:hypothetical protein